MKYPKLPFELDRRKKITEKVKVIMKKMHSSGKGYRSIASVFKCHHSTVRYWVNAEYRVSKNALNVRKMKEKIKNDSEFKTKHYKQHYASIKERVKKFSPYREYRNEKVRYVTARKHKTSS